MYCLDLVLLLYVLLGMSYSGGVLTAGLLTILPTHNCRVGLRHQGRGSHSQENKLMWKKVHNVVHWDIVEDVVAEKWKYVG